MARYHSRIVHGIRRLASKGWTADAIARVYNLPRGDVREIMVRDALREISVPRRPPRPPGGRRPARVEWSSLHGPEWRDDGPSVDVTPAIAAAELLPPVPGGCGPPAALPAIAPAPSAEDWGAVRGGRVGERSPMASLDDAAAGRARELRARGVPRKDAAAMLGVSVATITRITRGETYRPAAAGPDRVVIAGPPGVPPPGLPEPRGRWGDHRGHRRGDSMAAELRAVRALPAPDVAEAPAEPARPIGPIEHSPAARDEWGGPANVAGVRLGYSGEDLRRLYDEGLTLRQIGDRLGCSEASVCRRARALGLTRPRPGVHRPAPTPEGPSRRREG